MKCALSTAIVLACAACTGFSSPRAPESTPIDQTRPLDPRGSIEIDNLKGHIQLRAWPRNEVHISGSLGEGVEKLVVEGDARHLVVRVQYPRQIGAWRGDRSAPSNLVLQVPLRADLAIQSISADVAVDGVAPTHLGVDTVSGTVIVAAAPRRADIQSVSGNLRLTLNSGDVKVQTVGGDIVLRGRLTGQVHAETASGRLAINSTGERMRWLSTRTVSGDVVVHGALAEEGQIKSQSVSGDIHLYLPKTLSARVGGESSNGVLRAPGAIVRKETFGPGSNFEQRYGGGNGEVRLETFSGDAELTLE